MSPIVVIDAHRHRSYVELDDRVGRLVAGLVAAGIRPEERVLVQIPHRVAYVEAAVFALFRVGTIPVFTLPAHRENELAGIAAIRRHVREAGLAEWKLPDIVKVIETFPETGVGR